MSGYKIVSGSVDSITARVMCGGCGQRFNVDLDEARKLPRDWSLWDEVVDCARSLGSVQGEHILCRECTSKVDAGVPEDRNATRAEVEAILSRESAR